MEIQKVLRGKWVWTMYRVDRLGKDILHSINQSGARQQEIPSHYYEHVQLIL